MLFNSLTYVVFLAISILLYFVLKRPNWRVYLICVASILFYSFWRWEYSSIMLLSAVIDYYSSLKIQSIYTRGEESKAAKPYLLVSIFMNLGLLVFFKYTYFLYDNLVAFTSLFGVSSLPAKFPWEIVLPMGISFYTFQTMSYTIDIYRKVYPAEKNFFHYLAYVTFWPQLVAGPILRADELLGQLYVKHKFKLDNLFIGGRRILFGLFKKVILADNIAKSVDYIYSLNPGSLTAWDVIVAAFLFGFQIYFDFSGYSDIALGSARIMGFTLPENFNWPYLSKSPKEFWKNWHISLSSWIRDYLYIPLSGQKFKIMHGTQGGLSEVVDTGQSSVKGNTRKFSLTYFLAIVSNKNQTVLKDNQNVPAELLGEEKPAKKLSAFKLNLALFLTWFIMGLWHGSGWNFALWGVYHAFFIFIYRFFNSGKFENKFPAIATAVTLVIAMMGWIPFRARTLEATITMYSRLFTVSAYNPMKHVVSFIDYGVVLLLLGGMVISWLVTFKMTKLASNSTARIIFYALLVTVVLIYLQASEQFIYFQF